MRASNRVRSTHVRRRPSPRFLRHFLPFSLSAESRPRLARTVALNTVGLLSQSGSRFLTNIAIGRLGGPLSLGFVATANAAAQFACLLWPTSAGSAAAKFIARSRGRGSSDELSQVAAHLKRRTLQTGSLLATLAGLAWALGEKQGALGPICVAFLVLGYSGYSFTRGLQFGVAQIPRCTFWDILTAGLVVTSVGVSLLFGLRGITLLLPLAGCYLIFAICNWPWDARDRAPKQLRREMDKFITLGVLGTISSAGFLQLSIIASRVVGGTAGAGEYAAALTLATPLSLFTGSVGLMLFPAMSEAWGRQDIISFRSRTDDATRLLCFITVPSMGALALCSPALVQLLWGDDFASTASLLQILLLAVLASTLGVASTSALTTATEHGVATSALCSLLGLCIGSVAWVVLPHSLGLRAVAAGYLAGTLIIGLTPVVIIWIRDHHRWRSLAIKTVLSVFALIVGLTITPAALSPIWLQILEAVLFTGLWLTLAYPEVKEPVRRLRRAPHISSTVGG